MVRGQPHKKINYKGSPPLFEREHFGQLGRIERGEVHCQEKEAKGETSSEIGA